MYVMGKVAQNSLIKYQGRKLVSVGKACDVYTWVYSKHSQQLFCDIAGLQYYFQWRCAVRILPTSSGSGVPIPNTQRSEKYTKC